MDLRDILDFLNVPNPQNLDELKLNITNEVQSISSETLRNVSENMVRRVHLYVREWRAFSTFVVIQIYSSINEL